MPEGPLWNDEEKAQLIKLWPDYSATEIGGFLNRTRNAVIGQAHKLGLVKRLMDKSKVKVEPLHPKRPVVKPPPKPQKEPDRGISILDAGFYHCRAVIAYDDDYRRLARYCGKTIEEGARYSYCPEHLAQFTTRGTAYRGGVSYYAQFRRRTHS